MKYICYIAGFVLLFSCNPADQVNDAIEDIDLSSEEEVVLEVRTYDDSIALAEFFLPIQERDSYKDCEILSGKVKKYFTNAVMEDSDAAGFGKVFNEDGEYVQDIFINITGEDTTYSDPPETDHKEIYHSFGLLNRVTGLTIDEDETFRKEYIYSLGEKKITVQSYYDDKLSAEYHFWFNDDRQLIKESYETFDEFAMHGVTEYEYDDHGNVILEKDDNQG
mgnify:CR=1 FL=1